jgi:hypothetical protein
MSTTDLLTMLLVDDEVLLVIECPGPQYIRHRNPHVFTVCFLGKDNADILWQDISLIMVIFACAASLHNARYVT